MTLSFAFGGNSGQTYEELLRRRAYAESIQKSGDNKPQTAGEGIMNGVSSVLSQLMLNKLGAQEQAGRDKFSSALGQIIGGGGQPSAPQVPQIPYDANSPSAIGDSTMATLGKPSNNYKPGDRESFINAFMPHALEASQKAGVDPRIILAQAAQETGWGGHAPGNNYFGIKSHGQDGGNNLATTEYVNGQPTTVNDSFRTYNGMHDSAMGYADFLQNNPRYQPMLNAQGMDAQLAALGQSGYATDPNYASSVRAIANSIDPRLIEAAGSPYATPEQKNILTALIEQKMRQSDPAYQIGLQKSQAELAAMQNPTAKMPETVTTRLMLAKQAGLQPGTEEYQNFMVTGNTIGRGANEYGLNPQVGRDKDGNPILLQVGKDGTVVQSKMPDGVSLAMDEKAFQSAKGKAAGEVAGAATAAIPGAEVAADTVSKQIDAILNDPSLDRYIGPVQGRLPNVFAGANAFQSRLDQIKGGLFMQAYQSLKGGGQITEVEGQKATDAMARLNTAQSEADFRSALSDIKDVMQAGINRMKAQSGVTLNGPQAVGKTYTYDPKTGELK